MVIEGAHVAVVAQHTGEHTAPIVFVGIRIVVAGIRLLATENPRIVEILCAVVRPYHARKGQHHFTVNVIVRFYTYAQRIPRIQGNRGLEHTDWENEVVLKSGIRHLAGVGQHQIHSRLPLLVVDHPISRFRIIAVHIVQK